MKTEQRRRVFKKSAGKERNEKRRSRPLGSREEKMGSAKRGLQSRWATKGNRRDLSGDKGAQSAALWEGRSPPLSQNQAGLLSKTSKTSEEGGPQGTGTFGGGVEGGNCSSQGVLAVDCVEDIQRCGQGGLREKAREGKGWTWT